ncbi:hypothetical protein DV735_g2029, partial [Chaetothyriales sp. CBS 134920]
MPSRPKERTTASRIQKKRSQSRKKAASSASKGHAEAADTKANMILPMQEPYMQQIVDGEENYEFRKYCLKPSVKRIRFYYVCEILPAKTRIQRTPLQPGQPASRLSPAPSSHLFNHTLGTTYGVKSAPRGMVYTPAAVLKDVEWQKPTKLRVDDESR